MNALKPKRTWILSVLYLAGVMCILATALSHPFVFRWIYALKMSEEHMEDGVRIAGGLWQSKPFYKINSELVNAYGLTMSELNHYEDVRTLIQKLPSLSIALIGIPFLFILLDKRSRWRLMHVRSLVLLFTIIPLVGLLGYFSWDALFEGFHIMFFKDDSWILSSTAYSLFLYPEAFWQYMFILYFSLLLFLFVTPLFIVRQENRA